MDSNLLKKVKLDNGLELEIYDVSRKVAGDRWLVKLMAKIDIPVNDYLEEMPSDMDTNEIREVLGEEVVFEKTTERNFVDDKEKEVILSGFLETLTENLVPYFSSSNFPTQLIAKRYKEAKAQGNWYQE